jgi:hypothetical protein
MALLGTTAITLADWAARMDDNNRTAAIVEMLSITNEVLSDMIWLEGNLPTGHKTTVRTGLPAGTWRCSTTASRSRSRPPRRSLIPAAIWRITPRLTRTSPI